MTQKKQPATAKAKAARKKPATAQEKKPATKPKVSKRKAYAPSPATVLAFYDAISGVLPQQPTVAPALPAATAALYDANLDAAEITFMEIYMTNGNRLARAAVAAFPSLSYTGSIMAGTRTLQKAQGYLGAIMDDYNLSLVDLIGLIDEGAHAERAVLVKIDGNSKKKEVIGVPDHQTRFRFVDLALKLRGALAAKEPEVVVMNPTINATNTTLNLNRGMINKITEVVMEETGRAARERYVSTVSSEGGAA